MTNLTVGNQVTFEFKNDDYMSDCLITFEVTRIEEKRIYLNKIELDGKVNNWGGIGYTKFNKWMKKYLIN